jgi:hypothetical protein
MKKTPLEVKLYCHHTSTLLQNKGIRAAEKYLYNLPQGIYDKIVDMSIDHTDVDKVFKDLEKHRNYVSKYFRVKEERSLQGIRGVH